MRCPVPYALVALFGWGVFGWISASLRRGAHSFMGGIKNGRFRLRDRSVTASARYRAP